MKAMTYRGPYNVRIEEKDIPSIEHPNDAIVRVELAAICGSDLHLYHGMMPDTRVGHTFGHECCSMAFSTSICRPHRRGVLASAHAAEFTVLGCQNLGTRFNPP
jgi:hypothetical protein